MTLTLVFNNWSAKFINSGQVRFQTVMNGKQIYVLDFVVT